MKKTALLAAAAVLALTAGAVAKPAHPSLAVKGTTAKIFHKVSPFTVLYDQNSNDSGIGIVSQNFESSFDQYDAQAADDFQVPHGSSWKVREVDASGVYFNGSGLADSENVTFYKKGKHHLPGAVVRSFTAAGADNGFGSFVITLPGKGVTLKSGTYWVSVQANMSFVGTGPNGGQSGEWGWENRADVVGSPAAWQNPGDGFVTGCTSYAVETTCIPDGQGDHMFTLQGTAH